MYSYETLSEALTDLQKRGYTHDFNLDNDCLECKTLNRKFKTDTFNVVEIYRFEGMSSTDDSCVLYVIEAGSVKGTLVDAYGMYAESLTDEMIQKMKIIR